MINVLYEAQKRRAEFAEEQRDVIGRRLEYITNQLRSPDNRTSRTTLQQCKLFDLWLSEIDKITFE